MRRQQLPISAWSLGQGYLYYGQHPVLVLTPCLGPFPGGDTVADEEVNLVSESYANQWYYGNERNKELLVSVL